MFRVKLHNLAPVPVLAAMLAPFVWPLFDHHFAERQPEHKHVGVAATHMHGDVEHTHGNGGGSDNASPVALYFFDGGINGPITVAGSCAVSQSFFLFEPSSLLTLSLASTPASDQFLGSSLDKPPQLTS